MTKINRWMVIWLLLLSCSIRAEDSDRIEQLRNLAVQWSTGLSSFSGQYTLYEQRSDTLLVTHVDFRWFNDSKYVKVIYEDRNNMAIEESFHKRSFVSMFTREQEGREISSVKPPQNLPSFSIPQSSLYTPLEFFFQESFWPEPDSMASALARGDYVLRRHDENDVLVRYAFDGCHEIHFDGLQRITQVGIFSGVTPSDMEFAQQMQMDFLEFRFPYITYFFDNYVFVQGMWFPLEVRSVVYRLNPEGKRILNARRGQPAAALEINRTGAFYEYKHSTIVLDEKTIVINEPLDDSYFTIDIPPDARLSRTGKSMDYATYIWRKRLPYIVIAVVVLVAFMLVMLYFKDRHRRPGIWGSS